MPENSCLRIFSGFLGCLSATLKSSILKPEFMLHSYLVTNLAYHKPYKLIGTIQFSSNENEKLIMSASMQNSTIQENAHSLSVYQIEKMRNFLGTFFHLYIAENTNISFIYFQTSRYMDIMKINIVLVLNKQTLPKALKMECISVKLG